MVAALPVIEPTVLRLTASLSFPVICSLLFVLWAILRLQHATSLARGSSRVAPQRVAAGRLPGSLSGSSRSLENKDDVADHVKGEMYAGAAAESRGWSPEEKAVLRRVAHLLGDEAFGRAEACRGHLLPRYVRSNWDKWRELAPRAGAIADELRDHLAWRDKVGADGILKQKIDKHDFFHDAWPSRAYGCDASGHPVFGERLKMIDAQALLGSIGKELVLQHRVQAFEAIALWKEGCSRRRGRRIYKQVSVLDIGGFNLREHFTPSGKAFLIALIDIGTKRYPETLHRLFIINAPLYFRAIWAAVGAWLDPPTRDKIQILGGDPAAWATAFEEAMIPASALPAWAGGSHDGYALEDLILGFRDGTPKACEEVLWPEE